jgi:hypothetical protein
MTGKAIQAKAEQHVIEVFNMQLVRNPRFEFQNNNTLFKKYDKTGENLYFKGFTFTTFKNVSCPIYLPIYTG